MKPYLLIIAFMSMGILGFENLQAEPYKLSISNGSGMPISPGVIFAIKGQESPGDIGLEASPGLVELCQTGSNAGLLEELKENANVYDVRAVDGPVLPGESVETEVHVHSSLRQSVHYLAMYGRSKDLCASISVSNERLYNLRPSSYSEYYSGLEREIRGVDQVIATGAFSSPRVTERACETVDNSTACLRELSDPVEGGRIHFFKGYLPSVISYLEKNYDAEEVQGLLLNSGSVGFTLKKIR